MTFRRIVLVLVALPFLYLAGVYLRRAFASPETRIHWVIEEMVVAFNERRTGGVLSCFEKDFVDVESGLGREELHQALVATFFEDVDSNTHEYLMRAELDEAALSVAIEPGGAAKVSTHVLIYTRVRPPEQLFWDARIEGEMRERDGEWRWSKTTHVNHGERQRSR